MSGERWGLMPRITTHECPGLCGRHDVPRHHFACPACWARLPFKLQRPITQNYRRNAGAHLAAMIAADEWFQQHQETSRG